LTTLARGNRKRAREEKKKSSERNAEGASCSNVPVVGTQHDADLDETNRVGRQPPLEPKEADRVADAGPGGDQLRHGDASVRGLLAAVVADRRDDVRGDADDPGPLGRGEVEGKARRGGGPLCPGPRRGGLAGGDELFVGFLDRCLEPLERVRDHGPGVPERFVLGGRGLGVARARARARVPKLHLGLEQRRAGPRGPGDDGLGDPLFLEGVDQRVLVDASQLLRFRFCLCFRGFFFVERGGGRLRPRERGEGRLREERRGEERRGEERRGEERRKKKRSKKNEGKSLSLSRK